MRMLLLTLSATLFIPAAAVADNGDAPPPKKERLVCKQEVVTGSRARPARICKTAAEWAGTEKDVKGDQAGERMVPEYVTTPVGAGGGPPFQRVPQ